MVVVLGGLVLVGMAVAELGVPGWEEQEWLAQLIPVAEVVEDKRIVV